MAFRKHGNSEDQKVLKSKSQIKREADLAETDRWTREDEAALRAESDWDAEGGNGSHRQ